MNIYLHSQYTNVCKPTCSSHKALVWIAENNLVTILTVCREMTRVVFKLMNKIQDLQNLQIAVGEMDQT